MARTLTMIAMTPAKVQKIAAVYIFIKRTKFSSAKQTLHQSQVGLIHAHKRDSKNCGQGMTAEPKPERLGATSYIKNRQPAVTKSRDGVAKKRKSQEDEEDLPGLAWENPFTIRSLEHIDTRNQEQRGSEVDSQGDGHVADDIHPTTDPTCESAPARWREHKGLVVHTSSGRVNTGDLAEGCRHTEDDQRDADPAPDNVGWTTAGERIVHGG